MKIADFIVNIIASVVYDVGISKTEKVRFYFFKLKEKKWISSFCKHNDGSILLSYEFEKFLTYHKPIDNIFAFVLEPKTITTTESGFVNQIVDRFKTTYNKELTVTEERLLKDFFSNLLQHLKAYLTNLLGFNERFSHYLHAQTLSKLNEADAKRHDEILKKLSDATSNSKISDEKAEELYDTINDSLLRGQINMVRTLVPIIENRNDDLENGIKISLQLLSKYHLLTKGVLETYSKIKNCKIRDDVCRKLILHYIDDIDTLTQIKEKTVNADLKQIIEKLVASEKLYTESVENKNYIPFYTFAVSKYYNNEQWIVNRICFLDIQKTFGYFDGESLLETDQTFVDKLLIWDVKHLKLIRKYNEKDSTEIDTLLEEIKSAESVYSVSSSVIKTKYYEILLRLMSIHSRKDVLKYADKLPPNIRNDNAISAIITYAKIGENEISEEDIIKFCYSSKQYHLLDFYLYVNKCDNHKVKELLSCHKTFIKKNLALFLRYVQAVNIIDGTVQANCILKQFDEEYKEFLEYHLLYLKLNQEDIEIHIESVYEKWQNSELKCQDLNFELEFARMLLSKSCYNKAIEVLSKLESLGYDNIILSRYKVNALFGLKKFVDGLNILLDKFDDLYQDDARAIDAILTISLQTYRSIPGKVIDCALKIGSPRMLALVAHVKDREDKYDEARELVLKALLTSSDANDMCEVYMWLVAINDSGNVEVIKDVDVNRTVFLSSDEKNKKVYCIYKNGFIKNEPLIWEGAEHISEDTAISIGLLKKKVGEKISICDSLYNIDDIVPLDAYFFRICTNKMSEKGTVKVFHFDTNEDKIKNIERFTTWVKENVPSNDVLDDLVGKYKDFTQTPVPLYIIHKSSKSTYIETILDFIEDQNVIFRELIYDGELSNNGYVLSTAATVALFKIGVDIEKISKDNIYITNSLIMQIETDAQEIIDKNKREHNMSMGIVDEKLFVNEVSPEGKHLKMTDAVGVKKFSKAINVINNSSDLSIEGIDNKTLQEGLGICDYDALSVAINEKRKLVCAEASVIGLTAYLKQNTSCILDFLCEIKYPLSDLIECMNKMVDYKFFIIITSKARDYIFDNFDKLNPEQQQSVLDRFNEYFENIEKQNTEYQKMCIPTINNVFFNQKMQGYVGLPLTRIVINHLLLLNNLEIKVIVNNEGELEAKLYKSTIEHSILSDDTKVE